LIILEKQAKSETSNKNVPLRYYKYTTFFRRNQIVLKFYVALSFTECFGKHSS